MAAQHKRTVGEKMVRHAPLEERRREVVDLEGRVLRWRPQETLASRPDQVCS